MSPNETQGNQRHAYGMHGAENRDNPTTSTPQANVISMPTLRFGRDEHVSLLKRSARRPVRLRDMARSPKDDAKERNGNIPIKSTHAELFFFSMTRTPTQSIC